MTGEEKEIMEMKDYNVFTTEERNAALAFAEGMGLVREAVPEETKTEAVRFAEAMGLRRVEKQEKIHRDPGNTNRGFFGKLAPSFS